MLKRCLLSLSLLSLVACQARPALNPSLTALNAGRGAQSFSRFSAGQDWFAQLSPDKQAYYAEAQGKTGQELFDTLAEIVSRGNRFVGYGEAKSYIYAVADNAPVAPNGPGGVIAAYSNVFVPGSGGDGNRYRERGDENRDGTSSDFINCEHTWPQSFFNKKEPQRADMHHLFATFSKPNGMRGHLPFGTSAEGRVTYQTANGSKLVMRGNFSASTMPSEELLQSEDFDGASHDAVFEPADTQKGNTARAMLYFYMRWHQTNIRSGDYHPRDFWAERVNMFAQWSQLDPADEREQRRNELIFKKQGNRNPFIDIPNLTQLIGEQVMQGRELQMASQPR